jgi:hypothetical protein
MPVAMASETVTMRAQAGTSVVVGTVKVADAANVQIKQHDSCAGWSLSGGSAESGWLLQMTKSESEAGTAAAATWVTATIAKKACRTKRQATISPIARRQLLFGLASVTGHPTPDGINLDRFRLAG